MDATVLLTDAEAGVLFELLEGDRCRLLLEIAHTDHRSMKRELKARESLLQGILGKLVVQPAAAPPGRAAARTDSTASP
ncbi:MAG: hypothetical protein EHM24_06575 [Acidobacteria bacterium]|nr:MAG: hypothetical protein EHM24_06575 [Acidobacteriota bacterium]